MRGRTRSTQALQFFPRFYGAQRQQTILRSSGARHDPLQSKKRIMAIPADYVKIFVGHETSRPLKKSLASGNRDVIVSSCALAETGRMRGEDERSGVACSVTSISKRGLAKDHPLRNHSRCGQRGPRRRRFRSEFPFGALRADGSPLDPARRSWCGRCCCRCSTRSARSGS